MANRIPNHPTKFKPGNQFGAIGKRGKHPVTILNQYMTQPVPKTVREHLDDEFAEMIPDGATYIECVIMRMIKIAMRGQDRDAVRAATDLLDRHIGKAMQTVVTYNHHDDMSNMTDEELEIELRRLMDFQNNIVGEDDDPFDNVDPGNILDASHHASDHHIIDISSTE